MVVGAERAVQHSAGTRTQPAQLMPYMHGHLATGLGLQGQLCGYDQPGLLLPRPDARRKEAG